MATKGKKTFTKVMADDAIGMVGEANYDADKHDCGPWVETPWSTRVSSYRYDYYNNAIQVKWTNGKNHGYIYREVPYEQYRVFARLVSKGKGINTHLNQYPYDMMTADEESAPSNTRYHAPSRAR